LSRLRPYRAARRIRDCEAVFAEQWHAQVIAVVELLVADGKIDADDWSRALGAELDRRATEGAPDTDDNYYEAYLSVLESTLDKAQLASGAEVDRRESDWREAYLGTPHGQPVVLKDQP